MKRNFGYIFVIILMIFMLVGCDSNASNENKKELSKNEQYQNEIIAAMENELEDGKVSKRIDMVTDIDFSDGKVGYIEWTSSDESTLTKDGKYRLTTLEKDVTLHATVTVDLDTFEFDYIVRVKGFITKEDYLAKIYELIPDNIITNIQFPETESEILKPRNLTATIHCKSLNEDLLTSKGEYKTQSTNDETVIIEVTVVTKEFTITGTCTKTVMGRHDQQYVEQGIAWLDANFQENLNATGDLDLPATDSTGAVSFLYESSNQKIFNNYGEMVNFIANTEVVFIVTAKMNDYEQTAEVKAKTLNRSQMIEYIMDRMHKDELQQIYLKTYITNSSQGTNFDDFGFLNFFTKDVSEDDLLISGTSEANYQYGTNTYNSNVAKKDVLKAIVPVESVNRPNQTKTSVEFITIHDTGDNYYTAAGWAGQITTDSREVSWHFTIDDHDIYQHLPLSEVAWHAGDGSNTFKLRDTGIKYKGRDPEIEFREDNHLYINGQKSALMAPTDSNGKYQYDITPAGLYTEMGGNGNYWINTYYYSGKGYNKIANGGGNRNSIGIETCVTDNTRYSETMRACANLVAHMLKMYDLDITRVMQHRNFSGKLCPQSMIRMGVYDEFIEWIYCELYILYNLNGAKFTYTSNNPELVDNNGLINKYVTEETTVSYTVKVEYEDLVFEKTYQTKILPLK